MNRNSIIKGIFVTREVTIDGVKLFPEKSQEVCNHSPDGFCWNYSGSGPAQLALALLLEATNKEEALKYYQAFKFDIITVLKDDFEIRADQVFEWLEVERERILTE